MMILVPYKHHIFQYAVGLQLLSDRPEDNIDINIKGGKTHLLLIDQMLYIWMSLRRLSKCNTLIAAMIHSQNEV